MKGWMLLSLAATACATGAPVGGRASLRQLTYRDFSPEAAPRDAPGGGAVVPATPLEASPDSRRRVVQLARSLINRPRIELNGRRYPDDCTGLVRAVFEGVGIDLTGPAQAGDNGVTAMYRFAQARGRIYEGGRPLPGDLVFFRETYDVNRDGRLNDGLTHVGLVEEAAEDGTVQVIHRVRRGVVRYRMNLRLPSSRTDPATGAVINDYLRSASRGQREVLTGELFAAYATLLPLETRLAAAGR